MKSKLHNVKDDITIKKIKEKMEIVSAGNLSIQDACIVLLEIKHMISQLQPEARQTQQTSYNLFKDKVANFYLQRNGELEM